jgi:hypothetical protein
VCSGPVAAGFIGRSLEVVVEGTKVEGRYKGLSRNYLSVFFAGPEGLEGTMAKVGVTGASSAGLEGRLEEG